MNLHDVFFNKNKPFTPIRVEGGSTNGRITHVQKQLDIEQRFQESEMEMFEDDIKIACGKLKTNLITVAQTQQDSEPLDDVVYTKYKFDTWPQQSLELPIHTYKKEILSKLSECPAIVIEGSTGCGKSTQVPQMILDDARLQKKPCNIVVTQPRRIAAKSISERVSDEREWYLGTLVGYQIGLDKQYVSEDTRILFCTTGVLLEKLIQMKTLSQYTHIILDEIHERDKDMDFLFIIIRMLLAKETTNCKVILMSATIDSHMFAKYFEYFRNDRWESAPIIRVEKKGLYKVSNFYLDDLDRVKMPAINFNEPGISDDMYKVALTLISKIRVLDREADVKLGSVLVFLPGIYEIGRMRNYLTDFSEKKPDIAWKIFILHSMISTDEQQSIFLPVEEGVRKIILSTNIAESSITVPDVKFVIDFCLTKYLKIDSTRNFTSLEIHWASQNNCKQRAGRAGRLENGKCYRLITRRHFYQLRQAPIPELLLSPLENIILKAKTFEMDSPHVILGFAMRDSVPEMTDVANTVLSLKELGAMQLMCKNEYSPVDGDLTFLGRIMAQLPIDVRASRLIAIGYCYGVLEECIIMAAGLSAKNIFTISFQQNLSEYTRRLEWSNGSGSDLFAILNAYKIWTLKYNQKEFGRNREQQKAERAFCKKHHLDVRSLHECHQLVQELTRRLDNMGIYQATGLQGIHWKEEEKCIILKVVIAGAFYPNFFATSPITNPSAERDVYHTLNGRDPENTVYFTGFRQEHIRELYVDRIRDLFLDTVVSRDDLNSVKISFDASEKVFVTFERPQCLRGVQNDWDTQHCSLPGTALMEVYKACKMRKINMLTSIAVMKPEKDKLFAEKIGLGVMCGSTFVPKKVIRDEITNLCIPSLIKKEVTGIITYIESLSKFWFQPEIEVQRVEQFANMLNENANDIIEKCVDYEAITREQIIVARDQNDNKLYRARLIAWDYGRYIDGCKYATVCFIDYGYTQKCTINDLFVFKCSNDLSVMPSRCFQCRLAEIQPSTANITGGNLWDQAAIDLFKAQVFEDNIKAEIYSVVNGVVNVFIYLKNCNFNEKLINENFAVFCEENFLSKNNHWKRKRAQEDYELNIIDENSAELYDCDEYYPLVGVETKAPVEDRHFYGRVQLKGPHSPLEAQLHSMLLHNDQASVIVDQHSVNSVFLTSKQQDMSLKYMVAAHLSTRGANSNFTIHETTLLPNIRGFGPLMAMIFCPAMDLKRDEWKSRYISLRTGLGFNADKQCPYYAEHDAVFPLDFELTVDDIGMVNQIRYTISTLLFAINNSTRNDTINVRSKLELMKKLKDVTLQLLTKNRKPIELHHLPHEWKEYDPSEFTVWDDVHVGKANFPPHGCLKLKPIENVTKNELKRHCTELYNMLLSMPRPTECKLCETQIENVPMLRIHLMTRLHLERESEIGFEPC